jgi:hypothetical protein
VVRVHVVALFQPELDASVAVLTIHHDAVPPSRDAVPRPPSVKGGHENANPFAGTAGGVLVALGDGDGAGVGFGEGEGAGVGDGDGDGAGSTDGLGEAGGASAASVPGGDVEIRREPPSNRPAAPAVPTTAAMLSATARAIEARRRGLSAGATESVRGSDGMWRPHGSPKRVPVTCRAEVPGS